MKALFLRGLEAEDEAEALRETTADPTSRVRCGVEPESLRAVPRALDTRNEISDASLLLPGLNEKVAGLDPAAVERELADIQPQIDEEACRLYGLDPEDRTAIEAMSQESAADARNDEGEEDDAGGEEAFIGAPVETPRAGLACPAVWCRS